MPAYFPACWDNDVEMAGLMSMMKMRAVNYVDYDRKLRFWRDLIGASCVGENDAIISVDILKKRFQRGDLIPASLDIVVEEMTRSGELVTINDWKNKHNSWIGWTVNQLWKSTSWLSGASSSNMTERYIHIPTVRKQADDLQKLYEQELADEMESGEVIAWSELYDRASTIVDSKENFDIILELMCDEGKLTIGTGRADEKIIKFKSRDEDGPVQFTAADASVHDIRVAMMRLDRDIANLDSKIIKLDKDARAAVRASEKGRAANILRQKKRAEKDRTEKDGQYQKLLTMLHQIGSTKHNREVLAAFKLGTEAFKSNLERHGLSSEKIDEAMSEVQDTILDAKEIADALGQGISGMRDASLDEDLEKELDELVAGHKEPELDDILPNVPTASTSSFGLPTDQSEIRSTPKKDDLETRLRKLRDLAA